MPHSVEMFLFSQTTDLTLKVFFSRQLSKPFDENIPSCDRYNRQHKLISSRGLHFQRFQFKTSLLEAQRVSVNGLIRMT